MINFVNNGGFEWALGTLYLIWVLIMAKIDNKKTSYDRKTEEKWSWK